MRISSNRVTRAVIVNRFMTAESKAIIFYSCNLFLFCQHRWKTSHGIWTKLG